MTQLSASHCLDRYSAVFQCKKAHLLISLCFLNTAAISDQQITIIIINNDKFIMP